MALVLNVLLYLLLAASLFAFIVVLGAMVVSESNRWEQALQVMCLTAGAIIALGAHASGAGMASFLIDSLTGARPAGALGAIFASVVPGGIGAALGWYFLRTLKKSSAKAMRVIAFTGMLTVVSFIEVFAAATQVNGVELGAAAIPNSSFVAGLILSIAFLDGEDEGKLQARLRRLADGALDRRGSPSAPAVPGADPGADRDGQSSGNPLVKG